MSALIVLDKACECGRPGCDECEALPDGDEDGVFPDGYDAAEDETLELVEIVADDEPTDPNEVVAIVLPFADLRRRDEICKLFDEAQLWAHEEGHEVPDLDLDGVAPSVTESLADSDRF